VPTVRELSDPYTHFMLNPLPPGTADVCEVCMTFTQGYDTCYPCGHQARYTDAVLPISYSVHFGQLHTNLAGYKRSDLRSAARLRVQLAAVLWRFVDEHEVCLAGAAGADADAFDIVTTVPSSSPERDEKHPLPMIIGDLVEPTRARYERLLVPSSIEVPERVVDIQKYDAIRELDGESVLLVDDTWTSGASVQSAAWELKANGAGPIGALVIGRHMNEDYRDNAERLAACPDTFDWTQCALCR
jgi:hypothetical protein